MKQLGKYKKGDGSMKMTEEVSEIPKEKKQGEVFKVAGFGKKKHVVTEDVSEISAEKKQNGKFGGGKKITSGWIDKMKLMESF